MIDAKDTVEAMMPGTPALQWFEPIMLLSQHNPNLSLSFRQGIQEDADIRVCALLLVATSSSTVSRIVLQHSSCWNCHQRRTSEEEAITFLLHKQQNE